MEEKEITPDYEVEETTDNQQEQIDALNAKLQKTEDNFKKMARRYNELKANARDNVDVESVVAQKVGEMEFYLSDPVAREYKSEIKSVQDKYVGMGAEEAFVLWKAQNKPELLSAKSNEGVDGVDAPGKGEITDADLMAMSDEEFMKHFKP